MGIKNERVDEYIEKSAPFARPILNHIRKIVHEACPDVLETIKWSFPNFDYKGSILCSVAAFKQHCSFGFWLSAQMKDPDHILAITEKDAMGNLGQLRFAGDLPADEILTHYLKQAMDLVDNGVKLAKKAAPANSKTIETPGDLTDALSKNKIAREHFEAFPYSHRKEYIEWITDAKTATTREKRVATAVEWIAEGKGRNWKYEKK